MRCRVFLVEDWAPMRDAIIRILLEECDVVGYADDGCKALAGALRYDPDVIVLDVSLPGISGMELLSTFRDSLPNVAVVMLTCHSADAYVEEAFRRGANGYVCKHEANKALLPAVRRARLP